MEKIKTKNRLGLIELLSSFSKDDFIRFEKFVNSPFHNTNQKIIDLYGYLYDCFKSQKQNTITYQSMQEYLFPVQSISDTYIRKLVLELTNSIKKYFSIINIEKTKFVNNTFLIKELNKRNLSQFVKNEIQEFEDIIGTTYKSDPTFQMFNLIELYEKYRFYQAKLKYESIEQIGFELYETNNSFHLTLKLISINIILLNSKLTNTIIQTIAITEIQSIAESNIKNKMEKNPFHYILYLTMILLHTEDILIINELNQFAKTNKENIPYGVIDFVYNILLTYLVYRKYSISEIESVQISIGDLEYLGIISRNKIIPPLSYLTTVTLFLEFGNIEDLNDYINKYIGQIDVEIRESIFSISIAQIQITQKLYNDALYNLARINCKNTYVYLIVLTFFIQIYYEKNERIIILQKIDTLRHFINRKSDLTTIFKKSILKFITYMNKLINFAIYESKFEKIKIDLQNESHFYFREWLLRKYFEKSNTKTV